jgi:DNA-binding NarL/FixJ family response regulator
VITEERLKEMEEDPRGAMIARVEIRELTVAYRIAHRIAPRSIAVSLRGPKLSSREAEVVQLLCKGCNNTEAASALGISKHTVSSYVKDVYRKLDVDSRAALALEAQRLGILG